MVRLENYLNNTWQTDSNSNSAVEIARQLKELLEQSLPNGSEADKRSYYRMLRTVTDLQSNTDRYLKQAEESGDTEPALSLLIAYLKTTVTLPMPSTAGLPTCPASIAATSCTPCRKLSSKTAPTLSSLRQPKLKPSLSPRHVRSPPARTLPEKT